MIPVIYARVSTRDQTNDTQIDICKKWLDYNNSIPTEIYQDIISGAKSTRPALDKMMIDLRHGKFDTVLVTKLDRMGRSTIHMIQLLEEMKARNIRFIAVTQGLDTSTSTGTLLYTILSSIAQFERELIQERTRERMDRLKAQGKKLGRKSKTDPNTQQGKANRTRIANLLRENPDLSLRNLATQTGLGKTTISRIVKEIIKNEEENKFDKWLEEVKEGENGINNH